MAKVTITIEDKEPTRSDVDAAVRIEIESDPDFPQDGEEHTIAQDLALDLLDAIEKNMSDVLVADLGEDVDKSKLN